MAPLAGGDFFPVVNHEGNKTDKREGGSRAESEGRWRYVGEIFSDLKCI